MLLPARWTRITKTDSSEGLPAYNDIGSQLPRYTPRRRENMTSVRRNNRKQEPSLRRPPPERLSRRPSQLPAPSSTSPFHELDKTFILSSPAIPGRRALGSRQTPAPDYSNGLPPIMSPRHADAHIHRLHNVRDPRMHAHPALDKNGKPKRLDTTSKLAMGTAAGLLAITACSIM